MNPILLVMLGLFLLLLASWLAGRRQQRMRGQLLLDQFEDSTISRVAAGRAPDASGFSAALVPPPDPFIGCTIAYRTHAAYNPLAWPLQLLSPLPEQLTIRAVLKSQPSSELFWLLGRTPETALGRRASHGLWTLRRLDFVAAEYATRGENTNGIQHVFGELQTRYGPFLTQIVVDGDADPQLNLTLNAARFDPIQVPTLMSLVLGLGRAALIG